MQIHEDLPLNRGLLDARNTARTLIDLGSGFYPVEFFDLCSIIEEMVLRDEIVLVGKFSMLPRQFKLAVQPFIDAKVFTLCLHSTRVLSAKTDNSRLRYAAQSAITDKLTSTGLTDSDYEVTRLLGAEIDLRVPTIPLLRHLHNYHFVRRPRLDNTVCDLVSRYGELSRILEALKKMDAARLALKHIHIPPIALQVMQRAYTFEQITRVLLEVRDQYKPLRAGMRELSEIMADPTLPSDKFFQLVRSWEDRWKKLVDLPVTTAMQIGNTAIPLLKQGQELGVNLAKGSYFSAIVSGAKFALQCRDLRGSLLLRPLHTSVNNYINTHPEHMIRAVSRVFDVDPKIVRRKMEAVASSNSTVWRQALAEYR